MDTDADISPNPIIVTPDSSDMDAQHDGANGSANGAKKSGGANHEDPYRWAGFFKDDPAWDTIRAVIKADRAEIDAAQE